MAEPSSDVAIEAEALILQCGAPSSIFSQSYTSVTGTISVSDYQAMAGALVLRRCFERLRIVLELLGSWSL